MTTRGDLCEAQRLQLGLQLVSEENIIRMGKAYGGGQIATMTSEAAKHAICLLTAQTNIAKKMYQMPGVRTRIEKLDQPIGQN